MPGIDCTSCSWATSRRMHTLSVLAVHVISWISTLTRTASASRSHYHISLLANDCTTVYSNDHRNRPTPERCICRNHQHLHLPRRNGKLYFLSFSPWSMKAVTTRSLGNLSANSATPEGLAIRFKKRMRCSGTPFCFSTSTARVAEPPAPSQRVGESWGAAILTCCKHGIQEKNPSVSNICRQLLVEELGHACLLIPLDQDLSDAD